MKKTENFYLGVPGVLGILLFMLLKFPLLPLLPVKRGTFAPLPTSPLGNVPWGVLVLNKTMIKKEKERVGVT